MRHERDQDDILRCFVVYGHSRFGMIGQLSNGTGRVSEGRGFF